MNNYPAACLIPPSCTRLTRKTDNFICSSLVAAKETSAPAAKAIALKKITCILAHLSC